MKKLLIPLLLISTPAVAKQPLPQGISIVSESEVKQCQFVDIFSSMRFALLSASKTQRKALIASLEKAKEAGANRAVVTSITADNNQHNVTIIGYKC